MRNLGVMPYHFIKKYSNANNILIAYGRPLVLLVLVPPAPSPVPVPVRIGYVHNHLK